MAKEHSKRCRDCDDTTFMGGGLFQDIGNGVCSRCHGLGKIPDVIGGLAAPFVDCDTYTTCDVCPGNGQCQTCGGTGVVYYNDSDSDGEYEQESSYDETSDDSHEGYSSGSYSYGDDSFGGDSPSGSYPDISTDKDFPLENLLFGCLQAFSVVVILVIVAVFLAIIFSLFNHKSVPNNIPINQSSQPIDTANYSIKQPIDTINHSPVNVFDTTNRSNQQFSLNDETNKFTYADVDQIKFDLIGKTMPYWHFNHLSEFLDFKIIKEYNINDSLFLTIDLKLIDKNNGKIYSSEISVTYFNDTNLLLLSTIDQKSFHEIPSDREKENRTKNEVIVPYITQQYSFIDSQRYDTTGSVIFWTNCAECKFEVLISGQKLEVSYSEESPFSNPTNPNFMHLKLSSGLYYFSVYDSAGNKYSYKIHVKEKRYLFLCVSKRME